MREDEKPPVHWLERVLKSLRYPMRAGLTLAVTVMVVGAFSSGWGLAAALLGAVVALVLGELLGRSTLRVEGLAGGVLVGLLVARILASAVTRFEFFSWILGPSGALHLASMVWFGFATLLVVGGLRAIALRRPGWVIVELAVMSGGFASAFAAHRNGAIARPLWLSDPVWKAGYDPAVVLLAVGATFAVGLGVLLLLESKQRFSVGGALLLPLLGLGLWSLIDVRDLQQPPEVAELAEIKESVGEPPVSDNTDPGQENGGSTGEAPDATESSGDAPNGSGDGADDGGDRTGGGQAGGDKPSSEGEGGGEDGEKGTKDGASDGQPKEKQGTGEQPDKGDGGGAKPEGEADGGAGGESEKPDGQGGQEQGEGEEAGGNDPEGEGEGDKPSEGEEGGDKTAEEGGESEQKEGEGSEDGSESDKPSDEQGEGGGEGQSDEQPKPEDGEGQESEEPSAPSPIAVVLLGDDYSPPSGGYYLRQEAHSEFNGLRLVPASKVGLDQDHLDHFPTRLEPVPDPPPQKGRKHIVGSVSLLVQHDMPFAPEAPALFEPRVNPNPARFAASYGYESWAQEVDYEDLVGQVAGSKAWTDEEWALYTEIPPDQRYRDLADQLVAELPEDVREDPFAQALAIKLYLDANTKYTKSKRHEGVTDPTADYLFGDFEGYCVHTAHASVFLWRALGLPSRVGTGYLVTEEARRGSALVVMGRDAHAWPEVYFEEYGWIVLDVAPEQVLDNPGLPPDEDMIDLLSEMARQEPPEEVAVTRDWSPVKRFLRYTLLSLLTGLVLGTLGIHVLIKVWRGMRPELCRSQQLPRVGYRRALDMLSESGFSRNFGETREDHARRLANIAPTLTKITAWHVSAGLGPPGGAAGTDAASRDAWRAALRNLRFELTRAVPPWRRVLGVLNPFSFYWSR